MATLYLAGSAAIQWDAMDTIGVIKNRINFATNNAASSDVVQALNIPAGVGVLNVFTKVVTPVGATCTATVGDGTDPDGWDASTNLNASAGTVVQGAVGTDAYAVANVGKVYTAADTIDLVMANAATAGAVDVYAFVYQLK